MKPTKLIVLLGFVILLFFQGCETAKGAAEGMKKDLSSLKGVDGWIQDNLW